MQLQRLIGNQAVQRLARRQNVQRDPVVLDPVVVTAADTRVEPGTQVGTAVVYEHEVKVNGTLPWRYNNPGSLRYWGQHRNELKDNMYPKVGLNQLAIFPTEEIGGAVKQDNLRGSHYRDLTIDKAFSIGNYLGSGDNEEHYKSVLERELKDLGITRRSVLNTFIFDEQKKDRLLAAISVAEGSGGTAVSKVYGPGLVYTCAGKGKDAEKYTKMLGCPSTSKPE